MSIGITAAALVVIGVLIGWAAFIDIPEPWQGRLVTVSALAQIVGLAAVALGAPHFWALVRDQRTLAAEVQKVPDVKLGFSAAEMDGWIISALPSLRCRARATWKDGNTLSEPIHIPLTATNVGRRSATAVVLNYSFPSGPRLSAVPERPLVLVPTTVGGMIAIIERPYIHPRGSHASHIAIEVPREITEISVDARVSYTDEREHRFMLTIEIEH